VKLDCPGLLDHLEAFLEGRLDDDVRLAVEQHLSDCAHCRELTQRLRAAPEDRNLEPPAGLVETVLAGTTGSVCETARERLCDYVDAELEPFDGELMRSHLSGCDECSTLARCLSRLSTELPLLAELEPDPAFVGDVLRRTLPVRAPTAPWADRIADGWRRLVQRPRFALEGAYVGAFALALLFGIPNSPLAGVPRKALDFATVNPVAELKGPAAELEARLSGFDSAVRGALGHVKTASCVLADEIARRADGVWSAAEERYGTLTSPFASGEETNEDKGSADDSQPDDGDGS
jgi:anti-sigma factor RsiW